MEGIANCALQEVLRILRKALCRRCVYRKLKPGRNGDEARRVSGVNE
jgi:hypothetical protein